jgi:plastocyanin
VSFKPGWLEPHTVTFPGSEDLPTPDDPNAAVPTNPGEVVDFDGTQYVSSGFIAQGDDPFQINFTKTGSFPFACIIHPGMEGTVKVVAQGQTVSTQAELDAAASKTFSDALSALKAKAAELNGKAVTQEKNADGTTTWKVVTVGGLVGPSDLQQFFPAGLDVKEGDTVVWQSSVPTPHTVTFLGGQDPEELFKDVQDPLASPVIFDPTQPPASGYNGVGYINSGIIGQGWPGQLFTVKFTKAGSFPYACILHVDQGMGGVINVSASTQATPTPTASATATPTKTATPTGTAPVPPKTGSAGMLDGGEAQYLALMLIGFGVTLLAGLRIATGRWR